MRIQLGRSSVWRVISTISLILLVFLNACTLSLANVPGLNVVTSTPSLLPGPTSTPIPAAGINFNVTLPAPLQSGEVLNLSVLDEITGLGLNAVNYPMQGMDSLHYTVNIAFPISSVVKYRYMRVGGLPTLEITSANQPVRYRMYYVTGSASAEDVVSAWSDGIFNSPYGRISGKIVSATEPAGIANILIAAAGQQTLTDSNGIFNLENLPSGTHNLVAYSLDGAYQTIQQGARVDVGKTTEADLSMTPAKGVTVNFIVSMPRGTIPNVPVRLAGNLYQFGNTFGDLQGGLSTVAARMPQLTPLPDGRYSLSLVLPVGADLRYKYTLGDGFWNAEHRSDGAFALRQLIVPAGSDPLQIVDSVQTWQAGPESPILFELSVPANTPVGDIPSIQFNPYGWTEPIPMWSRGNNQWVYQLYSPLNMLGDFHYRYCRNDQCGVADDIQTRNNLPGRLVSSTLAPQDFQDSVTDWTWFHPAAPTAQVELPVTTRTAGFWAGVEFLPSSSPTWSPWMTLAFQNVQGLHANWAVLAPTWTISRSTPFTFSLVPGRDVLMSDMVSDASRARTANMNVAIFPQINFPEEAFSWWMNTPRSMDWWESWYDHYEEYAAYSADLAAKAGAQALILGGDWVTPSLPAGVLADGSSSGAPANAMTRWDSILAQVRQRFGGQILWATTYSKKLDILPAFISKMDGVYLLWSAPLDGTNVDELYASAGQLLDEDIEPIQTSLGKPIIIAAAYPSANGAATGTISLPSMFQPGNTALTLDLQTQANIYQAMLRAVNDRAWVGGFISRGYYPPVGLQDPSASIHGKPAADVLWYWFPRMLGIPH
jgi:hypothetical protein